MQQRQKQAVGMDPNCTRATSEARAQFIKRESNVNLKKNKTGGRAVTGARCWSVPSGPG